MLQTKEEIENWLKQHSIDNYTINDDLTVDVKGSVYLNDCFRPQSKSEWLEELESLNDHYVEEDRENVTRQDDDSYERGGSLYEYEEEEFKPYELPIQFGEVQGDFAIGLNKLLSLMGCPQEVYGDFDCSCSELISLEGAPTTVSGSFRASSNKLTSLFGAPESVGHNFTCRNNQLTTLEGAPEHIAGNFDCSGNYLHTLKGAPRTVGKNFTCRENPMENLEGAPEKVGRFFNSNGNFPELAHAQSPANVQSHEYTAIAEKMKLDRQLKLLFSPSPAKLNSGDQAQSPKRKMKI